MTAAAALASGATGAMATGATRADAVAGSTGATRADAVAGSTGPTGATGATRAAAVAGSTGPTGPTGATGATGATGVAGSTGAARATAAAISASAAFFDRRARACTLTGSSTGMSGAGPRGRLGRAEGREFEAGVASVAAAAATTAAAGLVDGRRLGLGSLLAITGSAEAVTMSVSSGGTAAITVGRSALRRLVSFRTFGAAVGTATARSSGCIPANAASMPRRTALKLTTTSGRTSPRATRSRALRGAGLAIARIGTYTCTPSAVMA